MRATPAAGTDAMRSGRSPSDYACGEARCKKNRRGFLDPARSVPDGRPGEPDAAVVLMPPPIWKKPSEDVVTAWSGDLLGVQRRAFSNISLSRTAPS